MTYNISWVQTDQVMHLEFDGQLTIAEMHGIHLQIKELLDNAPTKLKIFVDATKLRASYQTANHLRDTQQYMNHPKLEHIIMVADTKLTRLITLLAFGLAQASFVQFETDQKAKDYLRIL